MYKPLHSSIWRTTVSGPIIDSSIRWLTRLFAVLRRRFDSLKYDVKKIEEGQYANVTMNSNKQNRLS